MNAKCQMHLGLHNLANPGTHQYPNIAVTLGTSIHFFSKYLETQFVRSYCNICYLNDFLYLLILAKLLGTLYLHISRNQSEMHVFRNNRCIKLQSSKYCWYLYMFDIPRVMLMYFYKVHEYLIALTEGMLK